MSHEIQNSASGHLTCAPSDKGQKLVRHKGKVWKYKETMRGLSEESITALSGNLVLRRCLR